MPKCQFLFSAVFLFQKSYTWNILRIWWKSIYTSLTLIPSRTLKGVSRRATRWTPDPRVRQPLPACQGVVWSPRAPPYAALLTIYSLRTQIPKCPINYPWKFLSPPLSLTLDCEGSRPLPSTLPEGRSSPECSTSPCLPSEWCVSSSSLDYGSIAVARWLSSPLLCHHV